MNFLLKSDRYEKKDVNFLKWLTIVFVVIMLIQIIFPKLLPSFFLRFVSPIWNVKNIDERDQTIAELKAQIDAFPLIEKEYSDVVPAEYILGKVLSLPPASLYDSVVINVGSAEGVQIKKRIYAKDNIVLGEISEVYDHTSKAILYSSPNQTYDVLVGTTSIKGTATGRGAGQFEVVVPREAGIVVGDKVTIPGISTDIYGTVELVLSDPTRAFATAIFLSPIPLQSLVRVYVEK